MILVYDLSPGILKWYSTRTVLFAALVFAIAAFLCSAVHAADPFTIPDFSVHKLEGDDPGPTILIVGGIQGDEPGGFNAASLIATQYRIMSGNVWVVPNLNFLSIIRRSRGVYGDLNRKFARLRADDPEYRTICRIKQLIADPTVDIVLNLHDGSGYFRRQYIDKMRNPSRWGQCIIIDQDRMNHGGFSNLSAMAAAAVDHINNNLIDEHEHFLVNNTQTAKGNMEMEKTLTWFAINNQKAAFGIEASKSFLTPKRTFYHLLAIESFFNQAGIRFDRRFPLTRPHIKKAIDAGIQVVLNNRRILLPIENVRKHLNFIPLQKNQPVNFSVNHPLMTIIPSGDVFSIIHGNRRMTHISPQYLNYDFSLDDVEMEIDGQMQTVAFGRMVRAENWFRVSQLDRHRVNIIGFTKENVTNESGLKVKKEQILPRFSIDKDGHIFRVEVYKGDDFTGMVLVDFGGRKQPDLKIAIKNAVPHPARNLF
jgi:hypothetical protein